MKVTAAVSDASDRVLGERAGLRLAIRARPGSPDTGLMIREPDAPGLVAGVRILPTRIHPDDRGYFMEILRQGQGLAGQMDDGPLQFSAALSYPETIKALHYHFDQTDLWAPVQGQLQVCLFDLRVDSPTFGVCNTLYMGTLQPWQLLIPPGVGHGYKVVGGVQAILCYATNRLYNPADEGRIPYDDPGVNYDWETQHR